VSSIESIGSSTDVRLFFLIDLMKTASFPTGRVLTYMPYPDGGAATFLASGCHFCENLSVYGIPSTAVGKVIPPLLGHQSLVRVNRVRHSKVRLVFGKERSY
jgi:hypothetical protein